MIQIVARSHGYQQESIKLRRVLGDRYYSAHYQDWLNREHAAKAAAEAARQKAIRVAVREQVQREKDRLREDRDTHPVKHFEVP